ncbi:conserved exported hypothetical protein [Hyphomicrobiales bacterium]|nr:conserved exported hypothetical protein [Hyphomicrobiales bacterium]CAH1702811.1 conserved exported hypothetical protein [Hyphomicrobiales bacterium]CAI0347000.1 conserved exported hypothetical protein [Hyphomicrobiales bacterium]
MLKLTILVALLLPGPVVAASYCLPKNGKDRIAKTGICPTGYFASADCCEAFRDDAKRAVPKIEGKACPSGFFRSQAYCVSFR